MALQLGRRYASYDREYHPFPFNGLILLALVFAIPNIMLFFIRFRRRKRTQLPSD